MPWVRIDDHFDEHPKIAAVGPLGIALWVTGLAYCNRNLTDGFIPWSVARNLLTWEYLGSVEPDGRRKHYRIAISSGMVGDDVATEKIIALLVEAGIWDEEDDGYRVHDFGDYQPSKAEVEAEREQRHAGRAAGGRKRAEGAERSGGRFTSKPTSITSSPPAEAPAGRPAAHQQATSPVPDPVPSDPSDQKTHTRARRIDEGFLLELAKEYPDFGIDAIRDELAKCQNRKSWDEFKNKQQAFRNWMANARKFRERDGHRGSGTTGVRGSGPYGGSAGAGGVRGGVSSGGAPPRVAGFDSTGIRRIGPSAPEARVAG